jgi:hypothetical protein
MKHVVKLAAALGLVVSLSGCETMSEVLVGVADEMARQNEQQQQQPQYRRPSDVSARGVR